MSRYRIEPNLGGFVYAVDKKTGYAGGGIPNELVAAAPGLLEAAELALYFFRHVHGWDETDHLVGSLSRAVAKAKETT